MLQQKHNLLFLRKKYLLYNLDNHLTNSTSIHSLVCFCWFVL